MVEQLKEIQDKYALIKKINDLIHYKKVDNGSALILAKILVYNF